ncbi:hypothetical protein NE237_022461 [Protea cynaroides]|uniref:Uncharacterized protein n=1 Tax=Protea cynaroides TaxID=273540 RepID=A0A9Q0K4H6_9MAGN|nr:hypothetical protein NE237_022461 [Protea cynaroides]
MVLPLLRSTFIPWCRRWIRLQTLVFLNLWMILLNKLIQSPSNDYTRPGDAGSLGPELVMISVGVTNSLQLLMSDLCRRVFMAQSCEACHWINGLQTKPLPCAIRRAVLIGTIFSVVGHPTDSVDTVMSSTQGIDDNVTAPSFS